MEYLGEEHEELSDISCEENNGLLNSVYHMVLFL